MNIGIIGAGNIAGAVGLLWGQAGHTVRFGTRHPEALAPLLAKVGNNSSSGTAEDAAGFGQVVFCSVPYGVWPELAAGIAPLVVGKVVIDSANPYPERDGVFASDALAANEGAGLPVARLLPGARLVRAFNSVYFKLLETEAHRADDPIGIPLAGDDEDALAVTAALVHDAGFDPVVVGALARAREFDPGTPVYNTGMTGAELARALGVVKTPH